jgi:hypothetical protein
MHEGQPHSLVNRRNPLKSEAVPGIVCLCKATEPCQWTHRTNAARMGRVAEAGQIGQGNMTIHDRTRHR